MEDATQRVSIGFHSIEGFRNGINWMFSKDMGSITENI